MNKLSSFQKILIWILSALFTLTLILVAIKGNLVDDINKGVFNVVTAVRYTVFDRPIYYVKENFSEILNLHNVSDENKLLRENVDSIARDQAYINELETKNAELSKMLEYKQDNNLELISSKVIFRDHERWNSTIKINKGSNDNVRVNDAVLVSKGLIGAVESVEADSSIVRLLISPERANKVAVKINVEDNSYVEAIIEGYDSDKGAFLLSLLETSDEIEIGNAVVTSGSGGLIPGGILVGDILSVEYSINQLGSEILVKSEVDYASIENVFVAGSNND